MFKIINEAKNKTRNFRKIIVIISTYNGEKYLREQLNSILAQEDVDVSILIRDDGSIDSTHRILEEYSRNNSSIEFYTGENCGVISSFNDLVNSEKLNNYEYIAFCDQDDVWDKDKLRIAVYALEKIKNKYPAVYCSNLMVVDEKLNQIRPKFKYIRKYTKSMSTVQNIGAGCTQVFNQKALAMYRQGLNARMEMHDYWMTLICMFFGYVLYDPNSHIKYRQHKKNVVGAKNKKINVALKNMLTNTGKRINMLTDFMNIYDIPIEDKKIISNVISYNKGIFNRLNLFFSKNYVGVDPKVTLGYKIRLVFGRLY